MHFVEVLQGRVGGLVDPRSKPSTEKHGSLSTRQQLLNSQNSLENARKRAQFQRKAGSIGKFVVDASF